MRPIRLSIGTVTEAGTRECSDELLAKANKESQWRHGYATIGGVQRPVTRRLFLGEVDYLYNQQLLDPSCVEAFMPSEWIAGRDYPLEG